MLTGNLLNFTIINELLVFFGVITFLFGSGLGPASRG
jgi:hypothetical protein